MKNILVTGSLGLIGCKLVAELRKLNYGVIEIDIRYPQDNQNYGDIMQITEKLCSQISQCDGIVHLAAISRVIHGENNLELCSLVNVSGTNNLLKLASQAPRKPWLIYGSSREVYGNLGQLPARENSPLKPVNIYGMTKLIAEQLVSSARDSGIKTMIIRFSNVFGELNDHYDRVIPAFCLNAIKNDKIIVEGADCTFDFTYIDDVIDGIISSIKLIDGYKENLPTIHLTYNQETSLINLAKIIIDLLKSNSEIEIRESRNFDVSNFYGDYATAENLLNWHPKYSLREGLKYFIEAIRAKSSLSNEQAKLFDINLAKKDYRYENITSYSWLPSLL